MSTGGLGYPPIDMRRTISSLSTASVLLFAGLASGDAAAAVGGPDAFGYSFVDQVDGAPYLYLNITATGMNLGNGDDVLIAATNLGAPFTFYGETVNQLRASTNGFLTSTLGTNSDFSNDCPIPLPAGGGGFRIAPLHDDLVTTVYYQYYTEAQAAAAGFPGQVDGMSVFQWTGSHFGGAANGVNAEAILFHTDGTILTMVATDLEGGSGSTLGIQDSTGLIGLNYTCNTAGGTIPGVTAVAYYLPLPTDSDCCSPSASGAPGCLDPACETAVCAGDPFCCNVEWDAQCAEEAAMFCPALCATCGDGNVGGTEECDDMGESATCDVDCTFAACGDSTVNALAGEDCDDGGESATCDADCTEVSCGDSTVNMTAGETCDDGGRSEMCNADCTSASCGDGIVNATAGEDCDDSGETATCDIDCTNAECGDGYTNEAAGEECDDSGESKNCDDDCTVAECGDGTVNGANNEECDDGNNEDGDGCAADCTDEEEPGTTGPGDTGDTGLDTGADETADSGGGTAATTMGPGPMTLSAGNDTSGGEETDTDGGSAGELPPTDGCNCSTEGEGTGRSAAWSVLALFGLGALRRRRRRA